MKEKLIDKLDAQRLRINHLTLHAEALADALKALVESTDLKYYTTSQYDHGCAKKALARYEKLNQTRRKSRVMNRFFSKVEYDENTDCWEWQGSRTLKGYGSFWNGEKCVSSHRWSYLKFISDIGSGKLICHACDNPSCVNPFHLWDGTNEENLLDCSQKKRQRNQYSGKRPTSCPKGHIYSLENTMKRKVKTKFSSVSYYIDCRECSRIRDKERRRNYGI